MSNNPEKSHDPVQVYLREVQFISPLSHAEELDCIAQIVAGRDVTESARRRLVEGYLALVVSIARRYEGGHVPVLELIEKGNLGLMRAVQSVADCERDQFAAHAARCIESAITERG